MSFDIKKNWFINLAIFISAVGIILGTGSIYRFIYNYNLIMLFTMTIMLAIIAYQLFMPSHLTLNPDQSHISRNINYSGLLLILLMISFVLLSDLINKIKSIEIVIFYMAMLLVSVLLDDEYRKKVFDYYLAIIAILSIISIIFVLLAYFTDILKFFPSIRTDTHFVTDFYFLSSINPNLLWIRNQSIFWEPGAFGYHLMIATLIAFKNDKKFYLTVLIIACLTTFSTSVYLFLVMIFSYQILFSKNRLKIITVALFLIIPLFLFLHYIMDKKFILDLFTTTVFDKFSSRSSNYISFAGRSLFTIEALKMFMDNIFIGAGHYASSVKLEVVQRGVTTATSGLAGLLAEFGLYGVFCIFLYIRFFKYFKIFAIPIALIWLNGEFLQYSPMSLLILADSANSLAKKLFP